MARWGSTVVTERVAGVPLRVYRDRPRMVWDLVEAGGEWGDAEFLVQGERRVSFDSFLSTVDHAAKGLLDRGAIPGARILLFAHSSPAWVLALFATWRIGAVPVAANRWWSDGELRQAVDLVNPKLVVTDRQDLTEVLGDAPTVVDAADLAPGGADRVERELPLPDVDEDDVAMILFTSGSTGPPKGVMLSHRSIVANQQNLLVRTGRLPGGSRARSTATSLLTVPLFHIGGISAVVTALVTGARLVFLRGRFDPTEVLELVERERVTTWGGVPTMVGRVLREPDIGRYDLSSLRSCPLGGSSVPTTLVDEVRRHFPGLRGGLANTWGLSEAGGFMTIAGGAELIDAPGAVGRPYPTVELAVDAPDGGDGEVLVRSATVMTGYFESEDQPIDKQGWLRTGDVGRIDPQGRLFITGRAKDIVIRGGENIACPHVEAELLAHPEIDEIAVFGIPHDDWGEQVVAVVVAAQGSSVTSSAIEQFARGHLAHFEMPGLWWFRDESLPTVAAGKVDKPALRAAVMADISLAEQAVGR